MKLFYFLLTFLFFCPNKGNAQLSQESKNSLQHKLDSCVQQFNIPGISVALIFPNDEIYLGASGLSDIETGHKMDTSHLFQMASVTKLFTSAIVMKLIEQGYFTLDDTIGRFLPVLNNVPVNTKIRYLLNHRSGIADILENNDLVNEWFTSPLMIWKAEDVINQFCGPVKFKQNTKWQYSNTNYVLLGMLIEAVTASSFHEAIKNYIKIPYHLDEMYIDPFEVIPPTATKGWTQWDNVNVFNTDAAIFLNPCSQSMFSSAGSMVALPKHVALFTRLYHGGNFISDELMEEVRKVSNVNFGDGANGYGLGMMRYQFNGNTYYGHGGDVNGFTMLSIHSPTANITFTLGINRNNAQRGQIAPVFIKVAETIISAVEDEIELPVMIFPNPTNDKLIVDLSALEDIIRPYEVEIYNVEGTKLSPNLTTEENQISFSTDQIPDGTYFLILRNDKTFIKKKFMVIK